ncbi:MAG: DUF937 domain-containing protein [Leptolyngbyaceae cyanobacterium MO_188.B28]|nr:DUF937 domain-containing protein [Leptolyngbyaceae cyanobacterium MO_188.B28]
MGLFFEVLSAINHPDQLASVSQLQTVIDMMQELGASRGIEASKMQGVMSALSKLLRPALQEQRTSFGEEQLRILISDAASSSKAAMVIHSMFATELQEQMVEGIVQKTGFDAGTVQAMLPMLILSVLMLLNLGSNPSNEKEDNPLLTTFLDSDRDEDADLGEVFKFSNRFLNPPQSLQRS